MADAQDSKSCGGNLVWVQVPPPAFDVNSLENSKEFFFIFGCIYLRWEMYQIGICDDGKNTCAFIEDVVLKYGKKRNVKMDIQVWNSGEELCAYLETGKQLDILYWISNCLMSGIDAGIFIRKQMENHTMQIIYISKQSYAQLFKVQPMDFLVKPIEEEKIEETLALALKIVGRNTKRFEFQLGKEYYYVSYGDILCFVSDGRKVRLLTTSGEKEFYGKLKNIIKELPEDFLVIHKSYVVNKQRIARYTYETVELDNGRVLTISQAQRKQVREKLLKEL